MFVTGGGCSGFQYGFAFDEACGDDEPPNIVVYARIFWRHEICETEILPWQIRPKFRFVILLAKKVEFGQHSGPIIVRVKLDVVPYGVCGIEPEYGLGGEQFLLYDTI